MYFWKLNFSQGNSSIQKFVRYLKAFYYVFVSLFVFALPFAVTFLFFCIYLTHLTIFSKSWQPPLTRKAVVLSGVKVKINFPRSRLEDV